MNETDYAYHQLPAWPWSIQPFGPWALLLVAAAIIGITILTYRRNPVATRGRMLIIVTLRLIALVMALVTALRPSLEVKDEQRLPSTLLIGIDLSQSMTVMDGDPFSPRSRIDTVKKAMKDAEPILEALQNEQNVKVVQYAFGRPDFKIAGGEYKPDMTADYDRSDYGAYLARTYERWRDGDYLHAHMVIGDGADNGASGSGERAAGEWRGRGPIHTFVTGQDDTRQDSRDMQIKALGVEPSLVPMKNEFTLKIKVDSFGFPFKKYPFIITLNGKPLDNKPQSTNEQLLVVKEVGNEFEVKLKAPDKPGEVEVKVEINKDAIVGDTNEKNNSRTTYFTVTREGLRILIIDRDRFEHTLIRDVLRAEKRFDISDVVRQRDDPPSPRERQFFDFENRHYDVIVIGNISAKQLAAFDRNTTDRPLLERIREQVLTKGTGLIMLGGDATFAGSKARPFDTGWEGTPIAELLPVSLSLPNGVNAAYFKDENRRFQTIPTNDGLKYLFKVGADTDRSFEQWNNLNKAFPYCRITAISPLGEPKPTATVYAVAQDGRTVDGLRLRPDQVKPPYLMVGWETKGEGSGRVLAFAGYDTFLWKPFGQRKEPKTREGIEMHAQFWRRVILWLGKQDENDGNVYARPKYRTMPERTKQTVEIGLKNTEGAEVPNGEFEVKIVKTGGDFEKAQNVKSTVGPNGQRKVEYEPASDGTYTVRVRGSGKDAAGKELKGEAFANFIVESDESNEKLRTAADSAFMKALARAGGSEANAHTITDLVPFLQKLLDDLRKKPLKNETKAKYIPDWDRDESKGFLTGWVIAFALVIGTEWGLRRFWGLA